MHDIAMCLNADCPSTEKCLRFQAEPQDKQTYAMFAPERGRKKCEWYVKWEGRA